MHQASRDRKISSLNAPVELSIPTVLQIILASCFIGICAQIKIPLYFTPVPLALHSASVIAVGAILGSRKGALAVICYLMQGCLGLPVFAGGATGCLYFLGATGGYLAGFIPQAYLIGLFTEKYSKPGLNKTVFVLLMIVFLQLGLGSLWLAQFVGFNNCLMLGFYPFILVEMLKMLPLAAYIQFRKK